MRVRALLLPLLCLTACRSDPATSARNAVAARGCFTVHAATPQQAEHVLALLEQVLPAVRELPGLLEPTPVDVFVLRSGAPATRGSTKWRGPDRLHAQKWIEIELGDDEREQRFLLGHELVHWLLDETWTILPRAVEEGLADRGGEFAEPEFAAVRRLRHAIYLSSWAGSGLDVDAGPERGGRTRLRFEIDPELLPGVEGLLRLDARGIQRLRPAAHQELVYSIGYLLVQRIGVKELRQACEAAHGAARATLEPAELLRQAGLDARDLPSWGAAIVELAGD